MDECDYPNKNGIETCEDACRCGEHLRLHTYSFGTAKDKSRTRFYVDCPRCGITSGWHDTVDEAIESFDREMNASPDIKPREIPSLEDLDSNVEAVSEADAV